MVEQITKIIQCPKCNKNVFIFWGSFLGCGKKCPKCNFKITFDNVKVISE